MSRDLILGKRSRNWSRGRSATSAIGLAPVVDGLPHPDPLTGEQKEDVRTFIRHLPFQGEATDQQKFTQQLVDKYGPLRDRVRAGDLVALAKWNELVGWTNSLQKEALQNKPGSLIMLRNISRSGLFSRRFRVAN
jgi:hypothetical protein